MNDQFHAAGNSSPLISVIMPCFNASRYVSEAAASALGQSYDNTELVVVDAGSTDGSAEILTRLAEGNPGRVHLIRAGRLGPYPARNLALNHSRGKFVAFLDADDWWSPEALEKLHSTLLKFNADIAYCGWQNVREGIESVPYVPPAYEEEDTVACFLRTCPWPIHAALVTRSLVNQLRGFSERRYASMDYDFWLRALALTRRMKRAPEVLAFYRWHDSGQISAIKWRQVLDALSAQKHFIRNNYHLVAHLPAKELEDLTEGQVLRQAYRAFWMRDLISAHRLFRHVAARSSFGLRDFNHVVSALLPFPLYRSLVKLADRRNA